MGECRRYAPRPVIRSGETRVPAAYWPIVLDEEFCGEYQKMEAVS